MLNPADNYQYSMKTISQNSKFRENVTLPAAWSIIKYSSVLDEEFI